MTIDGDRCFLMTGGMGAGKKKQGGHQRLTHVGHQRTTTASNLSITDPQSIALNDTARYRGSCSGSRDAEKYAGKLVRWTRPSTWKTRISLTFHSVVTPQKGRLGYQFGKRNGGRSGRGDGRVGEQGERGKESWGRFDSVWFGLQGSLDACTIRHLDVGISVPFRA